MAAGPASNRNSFTKSATSQSPRIFETCSENSQCPGYDQGGAISQRCLQNPRYERQPVLCNGSQDCICSSYDEDVHEAAQFGYDCNGDGNVRGGDEVTWDCDGKAPPTTGRSST